MNTQVDSSRLGDACGLQGQRCLKNSWKMRSWSRLWLVVHRWSVRKISWYMCTVLKVCIRSVQVLEITGLREGRRDHFSRALNSPDLPLFSLMCILPKVSAFVTWRAFEDVFAEENSTKKSTYQPLLRNDSLKSLKSNSLIGFMIWWVEILILSLGCRVRSDWIIVVLPSALKNSSLGIKMPRMSSSDAHGCKRYRISHTWSVNRSTSLHVGKLEWLQYWNTRLSYSVSSIQ